jgi:hypothetical protein
MQGRQLLLELQQRRKHCLWQRLLQLLQVSLLASQLLLYSLKLGLQLLHLLLQLLGPGPTTCDSLAPSPTPGRQATIGLAVAAQQAACRALRGSQLITTGSVLLVRAMIRQLLAAAHRCGSQRAVVVRLCVIVQHVDLQRQVSAVQVS